MLPDGWNWKLNMPAKYLQKLLIMFFCCGAAGVLLAQDTPEESFLLYLSGYEKVDGEWVDPAEFAQQLEKMAEIGKHKNASDKPAEVHDEKRG